MLNKKQPQETFINTVLVNDHVIGLFYSHHHWTRLGSKRSIVEYLYKEYVPESDIDIITQNVVNIPFLENN